MITIIGLGVEEGDLTLRALGALKAAQSVFVRTKAPCSKSLDAAGIAYETLDALYEKSRNYDTLAKNIAKHIFTAAKTGDVCYCVDGGASEDAAARILLCKKNVVAIEGLSKGAYFAARAGFFGKYTALSAFEMGEGGLSLPLVVYDVTADNVGDIKLYLAEKYGDEAPCIYLAEGRKEALPLFEIDRREWNAGCALAVCETPLLEKKRFDFEDFVAILRRLRAPDGCPWDRVQTHESLRINAIEEAYELVDAIDKKDVSHMCEEAGDVLMQAVFHTLIEEDLGGFSLGDMLTQLCEKLITRHTHVFGGDAKAASADSALAVWDKNKMTEKGQKTYSDAVNDVPEVFPALLRAQKIAKRMEKGGWDAATFENFERKFREEYEELKEAFAAGDKAVIEEELGDVLFCAVELGRAVGGDCELALLETVKKCAARYTAYEALVLADGKDVHSLSEEEKDDYYRRAKHAARG